MSVKDRIGNLSAILFDKDGTLVDFDRTWAPVNIAAVELAASGHETLALRMCQRGGIDPRTGKPEPDSLFASGNTVEIADFFRAEGSAIPKQELIDQLERLFQAGARSSVSTTDLGLLFRELKAADMVIGIASNDSEGAVSLTVEALEIGDYLDFVCGYDSGHGAKPGSGMVQAFSVATGVEPTRIAVVGDSQHDMVMARSAGAIAIAVLSGTGTRQSLGDYCDIMLENVADLPALIAPE